MPGDAGDFEFPGPMVDLMIRRFGLFLLTLPCAAIALAAPAAAQYYSSPPPYYRGAPPPGYYDRSPPPAFWDDEDDDDDDQPVRGRRAPQMSQNPPGSPSRILPYPDEAEAVPPSPPGFAQQQIGRA